MKNIFLVTCAIVMFGLFAANTVSGSSYAIENVGLSKAVTGNTESVVERRTIVPYPYPNTNQKIPATSPSIEKMPFVYDRMPYRKGVGGIHVLPYLRMGPNHDGYGGFGTDFGIDFGIFRSHGLRFGIDFF